MFALLSRVFSRGELGEASDWGIDDLAPPPPINDIQEPRKFDPVNNTPSVGPRFDLRYYQYKHGVRLLTASNENYHKFMGAYLNLHRQEPQFWEKFKYSLIVLNLLDDAMILLKNEQALASLDLLDGEWAWHDVENDSNLLLFLKDLGRLQVNQRYKFHVPSEYRPINLLKIISFVMVLLKQLLAGRTLRPRHLPLVHVLLLRAAKILKFRRLQLIVATKQTLGALDEFLAANYRINKKIITRLISLKEVEQYGFLSSGNHDKHQVHQQLLGAINFLAFSLTTTIAKLMEYVDGNIFEQYCEINSINTAFLSQSWMEYSADFDHPSPLDEVVFLINKFNQLRKLLVCQLLLMETLGEKNFFVYRLMNHLDIREDSCPKSIFTPVVQKLLGVDQILNQFNQVTQTFITLFDEVDKVHPTLRTREHENVIALNQPQVADTTQLDHLVDKLATLLTNIKYFQKYHLLTRTTTSLDEVNEKLMIFTQFADELAAVQEIHRLTLGELQCSGYGGLEVLTLPRNTLKLEGPFSLKSFHTLDKKRFSQPQPLVTLVDLDRKSKRLSGINLLTVVEENEKTHEIKSPLEEGTPVVRPKRWNNRYLLNLVLLNLSGLTDMITATQLTNYDDIDDARFLRDELRQRLEESFDRIYSLELENQALKFDATVDEVTMAKPNPAFLASLDKTLDRR